MRGAPGSASADLVNVLLGQRIASLRTNRGLSGEALGLAVGVTAQQIERLERGRAWISAAMIYRLAEALETPVHSLFEGLPAADLRETAPVTTPAN